MKRTIALIVACLSTSACGGKAVVDPEAGQGGAPTTSTTTSTTAASSSSGGGCAFHAPEIGTLCVRGTPGPSGQETIDATMPIRFELAPVGCYSSSCTEVLQASCTIVSDQPPDLQLAGAFCLEDTSARQGGCTADCGGGGTATCDGILLTEGGYSVSIDDLTVLFTVPMTVPPGGACAGTAF